MVCCMEYGIVQFSIANGTRISCVKMQQKIKKNFLVRFYSRHLLNVCISHPFLGMDIVVVAVVVVVDGE